MRKIILAALFVAPSLAFASGYALPNPNARDLGLSASGVAAQRDSGAAFALPAALARIRGPSARVGGGGVTIFDDWTDPTPGATRPPYALPGPAPATPGEPGTQSIDRTLTPFPTVSVSYGGTIPAWGNRGWGVGLALQPFGGAIVTWPDDWAGRYRITEVNRQVFTGVLGVGLEVIPQVRLGGGLVYYYTMETLKQRAWMEPFAGLVFTPGAPDATGKLELDGGAVSYDVSAEIDPVKGLPLTIAIDYKHKATQELSGDVTWSGMAPVFATSINPALNPLREVYNATSAKQQLTIPNTLNIGVAYRVTTPVLVTFAYTFDRWVVYDADVFVANTGGKIEVARDYSNGHTFRAGVEYDLTRAFQLRGGVQRDISGLRTSTYSPTLPDASSWAGSLGATYRFGAFSVDVAAFYAMMDKVTSTNNGVEPGIYAPTQFPPTGVLPVPQPGTTFRGSYDIAAFVWNVSLGWTPGLAPSGG